MEELPPLAMKEKEEGKPWMGVGPTKRCDCIVVHGFGNEIYASLNGFFLFRVLEEGAAQ